jgi:hypothetical protein
MAIFYTDSASFNSLTVTGSTIMSASSNNDALKLIGSASSIFSITGSAGGIFAVTDLPPSDSNLFSVSSGSVTIFSIDYFRNVSISGSTSITGSLNVTAGITGSLFGTASWAINALTASYFGGSVISASYASSSTSASYARTASYYGGSVTSASYASSSTSASYASSSTSASFATTASYFGGSVTSASYASSSTSASYASSSTSASYAVTSSYANNFTVAGTLTAQTIVVQTVTSSIDYVTGSSRFGSLITNTHVFTGSMSISGSITGFAGVTNNLTASYAITASYYGGSVTSASYASSSTSASYASSSTSASFATTASYYGGSVTSASYASSSTSASYASSSTSASFATTASYYGGSVVSSSYASASTSASYASSSTSASFASTASIVNTLNTGSGIYYPTFVTGSGNQVRYINSSSFNYNASTNVLTVTSSYASQSLSSSFATTASYFGGSVTSASYASSSTSASYASSSTSASFASTASYVNTLNQSVLITGSLTIGTSSLGSNENTLVLGPSPAGGNGEGGQLLLQAPNSGSYTSASMLDNWQNYTRLLRGSNISSDAVVTQWNMHSKQVSFPAYNSVSAFVGTAVANLAVDSGGNILTVSTSGGTVFPYTGIAQINGGLIVTGSITSSGAIYSLANGAMYFRGGDDAEFWDINVTNTVGIYGQQDQGVASIKLGNGGGTISGRSGSIGIGTTTPNSASLHVNGNIFATSFTGSLLGTAATASYYGGSVTSASYASSSTSASYASNSTSASFTSTASYINPLNQTVTITGSLNVSGSGTGTTIFTSNTDTLLLTGSAIITGSVIVTGSINVSGSITGSLFGTATTASYVLNAQTASYIITAQTASYVLTAQTASYVATAVSAQSASTFTITTTLILDKTLTDYASVASSIVGSNNLFTQATGSYTSGFFKYTAANGTNTRAGEVVSAWNGTTVSYTDFSTVDIGDTSGVTTAVSIVAGNVQFNISTGTSGWSIKSLATFM